MNHSKGKWKKVLALAAVLIMVFAMGTAVYAKTRHTGSVSLGALQEGDVVSAGTVIWNVDHGWLYLDNVTVGIVNHTAHYETIAKDVYVDKVEKERDGTGGVYYDKVTVYLVSDIPADWKDDNELSEELSEEQKAQLRAEAWKRSPQNPKNYLPEVTLADGSTVVSTVPSHYMSGKDGGVSAVFSTTELGDFYRALGVSGGNGVHLYSYKSLCGPLMKQLIADHAAALSEKCGAEVTVADIFEMQAEIRDKNYKLVEVVTESSEAVDIVIGLQGELLKAAEAGADFAVLVYADGEMTVCMDTDEEVSTLTIHTTKTSGIYAIVYAPAGAFAGLE